MKKILVTLLLVLNASFGKTQPYVITAYIDSTVITQTDVSSLQSITYSGQGMNWVFDRRVDDWTFINTYLFEVMYDDGLTAQVQINPEFGSVASAASEAQKYAFVIGQLPACLRIAVTKICVHMGTESFGGGFNSVIIHTGQSTDYEALGILEEVLFHESTHTALDSSHAASSGWVDAQHADGMFISTYAALSPGVEDLAESFLSWFMVRQCSMRISVADSLIISQTIPDRLHYFDSQDFGMYPLCVESDLLTVFKAGFPNSQIAYPNPTNGLLTLEVSPDLNPNTYVIDNGMGQPIMEGMIGSGKTLINISHLPDGAYLLRIGKNGKGLLKIIKQ